MTPAEERAAWAAHREDVRKFQEAEGLIIDGKAGKNTWARRTQRLNEAVALAEERAAELVKARTQLAKCWRKLEKPTPGRSYIEKVDPIVAFAMGVALTGILAGWAFVANCGWQLGG